MPIKMKPTSVIKADLGLQPGGPVHAYFTKRCADYMDQYVPINEGDLAYHTRDITVDQIIYNAPYAHYMYEGLVMGPNIPIKQGNVVVGYFSPKGKPKHYTGKSIDYSKSIQRGHAYAGPHWDKRMWTAHQKDLVKEVQDYIDRR